MEEAGQDESLLAMSTLQQHHDAVWEAITERVDRAVTSRELAIERFYKYRVGTSVRDGGPFLVVLARRLAPVQAAVNWRLGNLEVDFGVIGASLLPEDKHEEVVSLIFKLVDLFLSDTTLGGLARFTTLSEMSLDNVIDPNAEVIVHSSATLGWQFEYMDNVDS